MRSKAIAKRTVAKALSIDVQVQSGLASLRKLSTKRDRDNLARFGINAPKAFGVSMSNIQKLAKRLGRDHQLAAALWDTGWYEARMLTAFVDDPAMVTAAQMDRWCRDFDNWGICDTLCFFLFDRTPHAWTKVPRWASKSDEFAKRAAFALIAGLALHDKQAGNEPFVKALALVERAASDDRNFVKKGVSWALRVVGRRNQTLNAAAIETARRLAASQAPAARWIGKSAVKELTSPMVQRKVSSTSARRRATKG